MPRIVQKFGGTSLADPDKIQHAAEIVVKAFQEGFEVTAVVSAMGETTDNLIALARNINPNPSARELDMLLATGEQQSVALMAMAIEKLGHEARSFTGGQAGIITENRHGKADIRKIEANGLESSLNRGEIAVVAGFQGITTSNEVTTLGRGGSDTTAVALAVALGAERCDIYTDVSGIFTADPTLVPEALPIKCLSYEETFELAAAGAKVIHPKSVEIAMESQIPVRVRSSFDPENTGTLITHRLDAPIYTVCGIALDQHVTSIKIRMSGHIAEGGPLDATSSIFIRLAELGIATDMIMFVAREDESEQELIFTVKEKHSQDVLSVIKNKASKLNHPDVSIQKDLARISIVGRRLSAKPELIATIFDTLNQASIPVELVSTSELRMSVLLPETNAQQALSLIHKRFGLSQEFTATFE